MWGSINFDYGILPRKKKVKEMLKQPDVTVIFYSTVKLWILQKFIVSNVCDPDQFHGFTGVSLDKGGKLNVHKTLERRPGRLLTVLFTFILFTMSRGLSVHFQSHSNFVHIIMIRKNWKMCQFFIVHVGRSSSSI